jgi:small subunit ribosomal protein S4
MLSSMRKNPLEKKPYPPGEHGRGRHRQTEFGLRLMEKQKARWYYGVSEKQFRMDNVVYRLGFATSRPQARQLVVHGHFQLNGRKHNVPSAILKPGDVITVREKSRDLEPIQNAVENVVAVPPWLEADHDNFTGRLLHTPGRDEIDTPVEEQLIIEFYSR